MNEKEIYERKDGKGIRLGSTFQVLKWDGVAQALLKVILLVFHINFFVTATNYDRWKTGLVAKRYGASLWLCARIKRVQVGIVISFY